MKSQASALPPFPWFRAYIGLALLAFILYANTLGHGFTVDDATVIENNSFTKEGIKGLKDIFSSPYRAGFWDRYEGLYRPWSTAVFAIYWEFFPKQAWPGHLTNVLLYALTAVLVLAFLKRVFRKQSPWLPIAAAAIFISHPLHTEVVANIKSADEIWSLFFGLSSLLLLFRHLDTAKAFWLSLSALCFWLALMSKESSIAWAGVIPISLWFMEKQNLRRCLLLSLPFWFAAVLFLLLRYEIIGPKPEGHEIQLINNSLIAAENYSQQLATAVSIIGKYIQLLVFPAVLIFDYSYNTMPLRNWSDWQALLSGLLIVSGMIYAIRHTNSRSLTAFAIFFIAGTLLLTSNIIVLIEATLAERFLYTPSLGFSVLICSWLSPFFAPLKSKQAQSKSKAMPSLVWIVGVLTLIFSIRTIARNIDWKDNISLLETDVKKAPESARIRYAYGSALLIEKALKEDDKNRKELYLDQAIVHLQKGVDILPAYSDAWYHLGLAWKEKGNGKEAVRALEQARNYRPFTELSKISTAGLAYGMAGMYEKALVDLREAVRLKPDESENWNNLGLYLTESGNTTEAESALTKALELDQNSAKACYNMGNNEARKGDFNKAVNWYKKSLQLQSNYSDAYNNLGNCYGMLQKPDSALFYFLKATESDPTNVKAWTNLSFTARMMGDTVLARRAAANAGIK